MTTKITKAHLLGLELARTELSLVLPNNPVTLINNLIAQAKAAPDDEIQMCAVAVMRDDGDGGLEPDWLLEGGTAELMDGMFLLVADRTDVTDDEGSGVVYTHPQPEPSLNAELREILLGLGVGPETVGGERLIRACETAVARMVKPERGVVPDELRKQAEQCIFVLREIGSLEPDDISGDDIDLRFEDANGCDTGCDVSIVDYAEKAADIIEAMLAAAQEVKSE
ncbi:hypothetical protein ACIGCM_03825 [Pseudomonas sp. NPDC078700]|uniref:hypothetical protein n=1 Tax=Pseudomonas sp. NPDC078700 TaxID=3364424 RepID=UPI0037CC12EF